MGETRRKFDRDFREGAVRLVRETGKPIAQVARDPSAAGQHDPPVHHLAQQPRLRRTAPPHGHPANVA